MALSNRTDFRFRAAPALDLRRKEEAAAAEAFARADSAFRAVERDRTIASARCDDAIAALRALECAGSDHDTLMWHRNWILRLRATVDTFSRSLVQRGTAVDESRQMWMEARRRRLALEKMRERAMARFAVEQDRRDRKAMDEVARLRHVTSGLVGGVTREH